MSTITPKTSPRKNEKSVLDIGFDNLPNQVIRKIIKKGFNFTFMVVGESGLGKSTLINSLFQADFYEPTTHNIILENQTKTIKIETTTVNIEENNVKLTLTLIDTPGFGNYIDNTDNLINILKYIDEQHEKYYIDENSLNRNNIIDKRIHCCFYFISPFGHGLKPLDIKAMKLLNTKVNIIPIIGKADSLMKNENYQFKQNILKDLKENNIKIFPFDICCNNDDDDDDAVDENDEYKNLITELKSAIPFAVCGANKLLEIKGKRVLSRVYPWGIVNIENPDHCDFIHLRTLLITHLSDLKDTTHDIYYEKYRFERMSKELMNNNNINRKEFKGNVGLSKDPECNRKTQEVFTKM